jgi:hypothetical protein
MTRVSHVERTQEYQSTDILRIIYLELDLSAHLPSRVKGKGKLTGNPKLYLYRLPFNEIVSFTFTLLAKRLYLYPLRNYPLRNIVTFTLTLYPRH